MSHGWQMFIVTHVHTNNSEIKWILYKKLDMTSGQLVTANTQVKFLRYECSYMRTLICDMNVAIWEHSYVTWMVLYENTRMWHEWCYMRSLICDMNGAIWEHSYVTWMVLYENTHDMNGALWDHSYVTWMELYEITHMWHEWSYMRTLMTWMELYENTRMWHEWCYMRTLICDMNVAIWEHSYVTYATAIYQIPSTESLYLPKI